MSLHDDGKRLVGFLLEYPRAQAAIDALAAEYDGEIELFLCDTSVSRPLQAGDVVARRQGGDYEPLAVIHPDGQIRRGQTILELTWPKKPSQAEEA